MLSSKVDTDFAYKVLGPPHQDTIVRQGRDRKIISQLWIFISNN